MVTSTRKPSRQPAAAPPQRSVQSIEVGGRLLLVLSAQRMPLGLKDLAAAAGLSPARAHPYLVSFARLGLVEQQPGSGRYALGPAALQMGLSALHQLDVLQAAQPVAEALAAATGHAVALAVWGNLGATIVRMVEAHAPLHVAMRVGSVMSLLGTATGRAFAAVLGEDALRQSARAQATGELAPGRGTKLDVAQWRAAQAEWRAHGVTRALGHPIPGVNAFSAPVFDHEGKPAMVITALGHQDLFDAGWASPMAQQLRQAAAEVSLRLGHRVA